MKIIIVYHDYDYCDLNDVTFRSFLSVNIYEFNQSIGYDQIVSIKS